MGDDQRQHIEITRDIAIRFNHRFGDTFVMPEAVMPEGRRPGDGPAGPDVEDVEVGRHRRRAASIMLDDPAAIMKKFKRAVTDCDSRGPLRPGRASRASATCSRSWRPCTGRDARGLAAEGYTQYGPLKADTGEAVVEPAAPDPGPLPRADGRPGRAAARCCAWAPTRPARSPPPPSPVPTPTSASSPPDPRPA